METILFISFDDILHYTTVSGNIDVYKVNPHIYNAQILYLEPILGSDLYTKIESFISGNTISLSGNTNYYTLLTDYITPSVVFHTMELFVPFNAFEISDGGISQHIYTNAQYSPMNDIDRIVDKYKIIGSKYDDKLADYLCKNSTLFPEYTTNTGLVNKITPSPRTGWFLGGTLSSKIRS